MCDFNTKLFTISPCFILAEENLTAKQQAQEQARNMSLNVVRLQFRVFLPGPDGQYLNMLPPVVSQPIYDSSKQYLTDCLTESLIG